MLWEGRSLRDIREPDLRGLVDSGLAEHLQLEYKSELYGHNQAGRKEFLLDICMFANTEGGILLLGISERRDEQGQPTGVPDPAGVLGIDVENPEAVLAGYDARAMEAIEERLPLESAAIDLGDGRRVLALRVPNSTNKPHSVRHEGHIYFPARRERQRFNMNVREIKEMVMRTASRLEQAKQLLTTAFYEAERADNSPYLMVGIIPIFFQDFLVDVRDAAVNRAVAFSASGEYRQPTFYFDGIERRDDRRENIVRLRRNGSLTTSIRLPIRRNEMNGQHVLVPTAIDVHLRTFVSQARTVYEATAISAPFLLGMLMRTQSPLVGTYAGLRGVGEEHTAPIPVRDYVFPCVQVDDLSDTDGIIRPLCDQAHQMFGREGSLRGDDVRTGVTVILPHSGNVFREKVPCTVFVRKVGCFGG
jgi:hypothetical protein